MVPDAWTLQRVLLATAVHPFPIQFGLVVSGKWPSELSLCEAIECMVVVLANRGAELLLMSSVDEHDMMGPGDAFRLDAQKRPLVSPEVMFELPTRLAADRILFGTRSSGRIETVHPADRALAEWLIDQATQRGFGVAEIILTEGDAFRLMIETLRGES